MHSQSPSLNQMVYDVLNIYNNGRTTKDLNISPEQVKFWIVSKRATYLSQMIAKGQTIGAEFIQNLGCVPVNFVDKSTCCSVDIDCNFLRSDQEIPNFLQLSRFGPIDTTAKRWDIIDYARVPLEKYAPKFSRRFVKGFFKDLENYLYIYYNPEFYPEGKYLVEVNLHAVLEDPTLAAGFNNCTTGKECYGDDDAFPVSLKMWDAIKRDILQTELRLASITEEDDTNNSKSDQDINQLKRTNGQGRKTQ